ncbi:MAG: LLM class F420-dependent oxidoreductase [Acidimicrobiales bacterium]
MSDASPRPIRVGVQLPQYDADYGPLRDAVARAEDVGFDAVFNWDHFFGPRDSDTKSFEAWTMLGAWAESTSRIEFGTLVSATAYRNPDLIADMARTLDHISSGRFILGLGAGFKERDFVEYGYDFATPALRVARFGDALTRVVERMDQLNPAPTRRVPPLIGGGGEKKTLPLVARYANIWHTFGRRSRIRSQESHSRRTLRRDWTRPWRD